MQFWSEAANYRTISTKSPFFEDAEKVEPNKCIFGGAFKGKGFNNGGAWLMSVNRHPVKGGTNLVGYYHVQDNYQDPLSGAAAAWKSIGVAYSTDDGLTWTDGGQVITSDKPRPPDTEPKFGGAGDFGCVWDWRAKKWVMLFGGDDMISMAISADVDGKPGSWLKYAGPGKGFVNLGLGGVGFPVGGQVMPDGSFNWGDKRGLALRSGSNPGLHYNSFLGLWICVWNGWDNALYISGNPDMMNPDGWEAPKEVTKSADGSKAWHATVVSAKGGSAWCDGPDARLYYADKWRAPDLRDFVVRSIKFARAD